MNASAGGGCDGGAGEGRRGGGSGFEARGAFNGGNAVPFDANEDDGGRSGEGSSAALPSTGEREVEEEAEVWSETVGCTMPPAGRWVGSGAALSMVRTGAGGGGGRKNNCCSKDCKSIFLHPTSTDEASEQSMHLAFSFCNASIISGHM